MSDVSSVQTTSFHTRLSFLDEENDDILLEDEGDDDDGYGEEYPVVPRVITNCPRLYSS